MLMGKRPCMGCQQNMATIRFTRIVNGTADTVFLCQNCAADRSPYQKKAAHHLDEILSKILGTGGSGPVAPTSSEAGPPGSQRPGDTTADLMCSGCGLPYASYADSLILGCSECYTSFEKLLINDFQRFHKATRHTGRVPRSQREQVSLLRNVEELKRRLADAVREEDFLLAARLRDEIRALEGEPDPAPENPQ